MRWCLALAGIAAASLLLAAGGALPGPSRWLVQATPFLRYPIKNAGLAALALPLLADDSPEADALREHLCRGAQSDRRQENTQ